VKYSFLIGLCICSSGGLSATAQESAFYGDAGGGIVQGEFFEEATYGVIQVRAGYDFNRHFGVEFEGGTGVADEEYTNSTESINFTAGAFGRLKYPISRTTEVFTRVGMINAELESNARDGSSSFTVEDTGVAFGVGVTTLFAGQNGIRLDYTRTNFDLELSVAEADVNADVLTLALYRRF